MPTKVDLKTIKTLRDETGAGIMEVKQALEATKGNLTKAKEWLKKQGASKTAKRADKEANEGQVFGYVHNGRVGAMVKINCETDFVGNSAEFQKLGKEIAMQIASMGPKNVAELLKQSYIRDAKVKIDDLVKELGIKVKEKITISEIARISL